MAALHDFIAAENDLEGLRDLLEGGEGPNSLDGLSRTPLHIAVLRSESNPEDTNYLLDVVRILIRYGADVNRGNMMGKTPLHFAISCRNYKMVETLLQYNVEINQQDIGGYTALHFATTRRRFRNNHVYDPDLNVVKLLLKYGPELDKHSRHRETALMLSVQNDDFLIVRELLRKKASVNLKDINGNTAMHYALQRPEVHVNIVLELMRHGCSFNISNHSDLTPMTLYFRRLLNAPRTEVEKAKYVFKLYLFEGNDMNTFHHLYILELEKRKKCKLSRFILLCDREIAQMRADTLVPNCSVYDVAMRGAFYRAFENADHIPLEVFNMVLEKLTRRQYPVYCDLIAAGICCPYMNEKFAAKCCVTKMDDKRLNPDVLHELSKYLSNFDMLNMMIACAGGWRYSLRRSWYLPRLTYYSRCSVS